MAEGITSCVPTEGRRSSAASSLRSRSSSPVPPPALHPPSPRAPSSETLVSRASSRCDSEVLSNSASSSSVRDRQDATSRRTASSSLGAPPTRKFPRPPRFGPRPRIVPPSTPAPVPPVRPQGGSRPAWRRPDWPPPQRDFRAASSSASASWRDTCPSSSERVFNFCSWAAAGRQGGVGRGFQLLHSGGEPGAFLLLDGQGLIDRRALSFGLPSPPGLIQFLRPLIAFLLKCVEVDPMLRQLYGRVGGRESNNATRVRACSN